MAGISGLDMVMIAGFGNHTHKTITGSKEEAINESITQRGFQDDCLVCMCRRFGIQLLVIVLCSAAAPLLSSRQSIHTMMQRREIE